MSTKDKAAEGRERGLKRAKGTDPKALVEAMGQQFEHARRLFPTAQLDMAAEMRMFDAKRLASAPDLARFPELRGHIDLLVAERKAFREATGLDETACAYAHSWWFFLTRHLWSRHLARYDLLVPPGLIRPQECTNVFMPFGAEGVTIADNRDDILCEQYVRHIPLHRPASLLAGKPVAWCQGGVSSAVLLDDEPACLFPANPHEYGLMPPDCLERIDDIIAFMRRYGDFWGPGNQLWVDRQLCAVAVEKTNCLMAVRRPAVRGAVAITACAYLDEGLHAHQMAKTRRALEMMGHTEATSPDLAYHLGSRARYRRLVELTDREAGRPGGATLWGALEIVADHAVPFPARICLAGERTFPDRELYGNWSLSQHAAVITGDGRRCLYRSLQDLHRPKPVYTYTPKLMLGPGVAMRPEWQADIDAGTCELAPAATAEE